jgi:hypothetical protein
VFGDGGWLERLVCSAQDLEHVEAGAGQAVGREQAIEDRFGRGPGDAHIDQALAGEPTRAGVLLFEVVGYVDGGGLGVGTRGILNH